VTPIGIVIFDFDERISLVNPAARKLLGLRNDDLAGRALDDVGSALGVGLATLAVDETRMITAANGRRPRCQKARFVDRGFRRSYILIEELTAELDRSERETYEKLIRMISHEVTNTVAATNSLLASCRNYAVDIACDEHRADYMAALDVLIRRNQTLNEFTKRFSDLVKLPPPACEETDVRDLLQALQTMFSAELRARNIALSVHVDPDLPLVQLDRSQMDQVLINVIKNAVEAIDRDGAIDIVARREDDCIALTVTDTGGGLDEHAARNLFKPFFTTKKRGQGLGLTLVKEILTQHGFGFSLEAAERGACFRLEMPITQTERVPV